MQKRLVGGCNGLVEARVRRIGSEGHGDGLVFADRGGRRDGGTRSCNGGVGGRGSEGGGPFVIEPPGVGVGGGPGIGRGNGAYESDEVAGGLGALVAVLGEAGKEDGFQLRRDRLAQSLRRRAGNRVNV